MAKKKKNHFRIVQMSLADITPYQNNPRVTTTEAIAETAKSIKQYGFRQPIVVDKKKVIVAGHVRYLASKALGLEKVPVHVADLSDADAQAYRIADNRTATLTQWDYSTLISEIMSLGADSNSLPGWSPDELEHMLPSHIPQQSEVTEFDVGERGDHVKDLFDRQGVKDYQNITCPACKHGFDIIS